MAQRIIRVWKIRRVGAGGACCAQGRARSAKHILCSKRLHFSYPLIATMNRRCQIAQTASLSVSVQIVAKRANFLAGKATAETRRTQRRRSKLLSLRSSRLCGLIGLGVCLRPSRAALYRRLVIGRASDSSSALALAKLLQNAILRYSRLPICATLNRYPTSRRQSLPARCRQHAAVHGASLIP